MTPTHYLSIDRCKKLSELGFPKTEKSFIRTSCMKDACIMDSDSVFVVPIMEKYVCPSVMEMLDVMPTKLPTGWHRTIVSYEKYSRVFYWRDMRWFAKWTLPNTLADLIIWLVENSHLTFPSHAK